MRLCGYSAYKSETSMHSLSMACGISSLYYIPGAFLHVLKIRLQQ